MRMAFEVGKGPDDYKLGSPSPGWRKLQFIAVLISISPLCPLACSRPTFGYSSFMQVWTEHLENSPGYDIRINTEHINLRRDCSRKNWIWSESDQIELFACDRWPFPWRWRHQAFAHYRKVSSKNRFSFSELDLTNQFFFCRWQMCNLFVKSLQKVSNPIRMKKLNDLEHLNDLFSSLEMRQEKNGRACLAIPLQSDYFYKPSGVLFFKGTKGNFFNTWNKHDQLVKNIIFIN